MIPTSVTNSPPPAGLGQNGAAASLGSATAAAGNGAGGGAGSAAAGSGAQNNYSSFVLGLASLILEGRPIADDEYMLPQHHQQPGSSVGGGRLSPRPSTSRAAINITTNPYGSMGGSDSRGGGGGASSSGNNSSSSSSSSLTHQRWTQKLCQLRQISPAAQTMSAEPELVSLAINDLNKDHGGDYEIVRRVMLNRAGGGLGLSVGGNSNSNNSSAASSPGSNSSDNILHSLQSLATTCLRGGPALAAPPPVEPRPLNLSFIWTGSVAASGGGGLGGGSLGGAAAAAGGGSGASTTATTATASSGANSSASRPKHGPHCDQFLRKMGLAKGEMPSEAEEHICDMSFVNMTVSWET